MKLIIDIPKEVYDFIKDRGHLPYAVSLANAIKDGIPYEERPTGEWIEGEQDGMLLGLVPYYKYHCSECGYYFSLNRGSKKPNYCQECGADMRGDV